MDIILKLIEAGTTVDDIEMIDAHTPLTLAASKNMKYTVRALLDNEANPNHKDKSGKYLCLF